MNCVRMLFLAVFVIGTSQVAGSQEPGGREQRKKRDQLRAAVQEICPVSGNKLGDHGAPIKVKIGEEEVFLCCKGCLQGEVDRKHWATIHANFARAQGICPVMKHKLPKNPKWTIVEGQIVFVCCPPCTKKIVADPQTYLKNVDELYMASLREPTSSTLK